MQEFIIIDGLPYLLHCGKAYAVRWDDKGFTVGGIVREGISPTDFPILSELSVKAKCHGKLDSIGKDQEATEEPEETKDQEATEEPKPKKGRKSKGDSK